MEKKPTISSRGRKKWPKSEKKQPVVFSFRPTEYEIVPPERFKKWQEAMIEWVGLPAKVVRGMSYTGYEVETYSNGGWDD